MTTARVLPDDKSVELAPGECLLKADLAAGIPHVHACGGHARCSTCRVIVTAGLDACAPRNEKEKALAERLGLPPEIRLACQLQTTGPISCRRLILDGEDAALAADDLKSGATGDERRLTLLFADVRGFTKLSAALPAYDVVHLLNRYFAAMGRVVAAHGGTINNYMGDGLLALFGLDDEEKAPLQAVTAALGMLRAVEDLRPYFRAAYGLDFRIGIGVHAGEVVVGAIGAHGSRRLTAIGDAVNFASRIEEANKDAGTSLLISDAVLERVKGRAAIGKVWTAPVKGLEGCRRLHEVVGLRP